MIATTPKPPQTESPKTTQKTTTQKTETMTMSERKKGETIFGREFIAFSNYSWDTWRGGVLL